MTLASRNKILFFFTSALSGIILLSLLAWVLSFLFRSKVIRLLEFLLSAPQQADFFYYVTLNFFSALLPALLSCIAVYVLIVSFKKTASPEVFFLAFFLLSFCLESVRMFYPVSFLLNADYNMYMFFTRLVLFSRMAGLAFLFTTSLFTGGFSSQRIGFILGLCVLIASLVASRLMIKPSGLGHDFLFPYGYGALTVFGMILIQFVGFITVILAGLIRKERRYIALSLAFAALCLGQSGIYLCRSIPFCIVSLVLLVLGTAIYSRNLHNAYLWS